MSHELCSDAYRPAHTATAATTPFGPTTLTPERGKAQRSGAPVNAASGAGAGSEAD